MYCLCLLCWAEMSFEKGAFCVPRTWHIEGTEVLVKRTDDRSWVCSQVLLKYMDIKPIHCTVPVLQSPLKSGHVIPLSPFLPGREPHNS